MENKEARNIVWSAAQVIRDVVSKTDDVTLRIALMEQVHKLEEFESEVFWHGVRKRRSVGRQRV